MLPRFELQHRLRPVDLVAPHAVLVDLGRAELTAVGGPDGAPLPVAAPYAAAEAHLGPQRPRGERLELSLHVGGWELVGWWEADTGRTGLELRPPDGPPVALRSRRHGRAPATSTRVGLALTGPAVTLLVHDGGAWVARARADLAELPRAPDVHDPAVLAALRVRLRGATGVDRLRAGAFGQLGLRDVRLVTEADGSPVRSGRRLWLTATHAGPGFARTAHAGTWLLDPVSGDLEHTGDLYLRRPSPRRGQADADGVHGDHAVHLVRDGGRWLLAATTWDELGPEARAHPPDPGAVGCVLATTDDDPRRGTRVLDGAPLRLPTGPRTVGTWDAHLVRADGPGGGWTVGYVNATAWFRFHPAIATGPSLDDLRMRAADPARTATEGTTLVRLPERLGGPAPLRLLACDGAESEAAQRLRFPVFDLDLRDIGELDAPYPGNLPWPSLALDEDAWWMVTFDGERQGGALAGYGTHGDLHVLRSARVPGAPRGTTLGP